MNIGSLNKRITMQSMTKTPDGMGGYTTVPKNEMTVWAAIWPVSASEQIQAMQMAMTVTHRIRIRYCPDINPSWRIKYGTKYYAIVSIINQNMANKMLEMMCKEAA
jgi:SPP1 family predicted phage head-tail adaptor